MYKITAQAYRGAWTTSICTELPVYLSLYPISSQEIEDGNLALTKWIDP